MRSARVDEVMDRLREDIERAHRDLCNAMIAAGVDRKDSRLRSLRWEFEEMRNFLEIARESAHCTIRNKGLNVGKTASNARFDHQEDRR